ncbi:hypothetical protein GCM10018966_070780 [Streptomyces yanii]
MPGETTSIGTLSEYACPTAAAMFISAGPVVVIATPGAPGDPRVRIGGVPRALLMARGDMRDSVRVQMPVDLQVVRSRNPERLCHTVLRQCANHGFAAGQ